METSKAESRVDVAYVKQPRDSQRELIDKTFKRVVEQRTKIK